MPKNPSPSGPRALLVTLLGLVVGCSGGGREEESATIDGKVSYKGTAVPPGSGLILEDKAKGVTMRFDVGADGAYSVPATAGLPAGTYTAAITPPPTDSGAAEEDYDKLMGAAGTEVPEPPKVDYPVPEKFRSTATSEKKVEVEPGAQTLDIDFGA